MNIYRLVGREGEDRREPWARIPGGYGAGDGPAVRWRPEGRKWRSRPAQGVPGAPASTLVGEAGTSRGCSS